MVASLAPSADPMQAVLRGDCRDILRTFAPDSFDACVTDPPYGLGKEPDPQAMLSAWVAGEDYAPRGKGGFMGEAWDAFVPQPSAWREVYRVLKPGAHVLAFFGTRTYDLGVLAMRLAGFEIRDMVAWLHGQGFPKNPAQLKPAIEPVVLARKPLAGTLDANRTAWGTGALSIEDCRISTDVPREWREGRADRMVGTAGYGSISGGGNVAEPTTLGRWPANVLHDGSPEVMAAFPWTKTNAKTKAGYADTGGTSWVIPVDSGRTYGSDAGSAARFFYSPKPTAREKGEDNAHPTVKGIALKRYLCRLVTPPGGTILDPYLGSGTTLLAARAEGFSAIGVEREERYADVAERRLADAPVPAATLL